MSQGCGRSRSAAVPAIAPDCDRGVDIKPGYCRWLLESRAYLDWLNPDKLHEHHGFFWIKGKPGCGKSTLTKFAFMEIKKSLQDATLLSFFFNARGTYLEKSTEGLYRSLLVQLLATFPNDQLWSIPSLIHRHLNENVKANREILKQLLVQVMQRLEQHNITVIIDALDECDEDEVRDMIALFEELGEDAVSNGRTFRVLFSSRHYPHITIQQSVQIRLEDQHGHIQDIEKYLLSELRAGRGKHVKQIREEIRDRASGVFIWVVLVVKILNKAIDHGHVHALREKLQEIPDDLNELFRRILMRDRQNMDEMKLCIQWILYSNRPLKPEELYFATLSGLEPEEPLRPWDPDEISTEDINLFILSSSKGLAEITKTKAGTVQFIHESVRDFLLKENGLGQIWADLEVNASGLSHNRLKECCFNYTRSEPSSRMEVPEVLSPASTSKATELRKKVSLKFPFLEYAIYNMLMHADISQAKGIDQEGFIKELEIRNWVKLNNIIETYQGRRLPADIDLLYILAEQNCPDLIDLVMRNSPCQRNQNGRSGNPIFAAIVKDSRQAFEALTKIDRQMQNYSCEFPYPNKEISSFLVKHGKPELIYRFLSVYRVDITSTLKTGETMLSWASLRGHEQIVKLLLDKGADVNAQGGYHGNALQAASQGGHEQVVKLLLNKGADVNAQGGYHGSALQAASVGGHEQIVKLLLNKGTNVNAQGGHHGSALQAASAGGHKQVVKLLLNKGANVTAQGGHHGSALQAASQGGQEQVVKLLLDKGANVNAQGGHYGSALQAASVGGHKQVVKLLLDKGSDINAQGGPYSNALQAVSVGGHEQIMKLLLDKGADVNAQGGPYSNALQAASAGGNGQVVKLLLDKGADVNAQGGPYSNALQAASEGGHEQIVKLLLDKGADINAQGGPHGSALQAASAGGHEQVVKLLLNKGADVNAQGGRYSSALQAASAGAAEGHEQVVKLLLDKGSDVNAQGGHHGNALQAASQGGHEQIVKLLLDKGADVNAQGGPYSNALQAASAGGNGQVVKLLLDKGADVNALQAAV